MSVLATIATQALLAAEAVDSGDAQNVAAATGVNPPA